VAYASEGEVLDEALRLLRQRDMDQAQDKARVEALLIQGLDSGPSTPMTAADWDEIEREGQRMIAARKARKSQ
jgi:Arc/MetJ-type ribon-helix-helix transcriptional regulator